VKFRVNGIMNDSIVDGPGLRLAVFVQGCGHGCLGCHNPQTHDPQGGREMDTADVLKLVKENPLLDGLTLSGGEPFEQAEACLVMAREAKARGLNVWIYSGYTYEALKKSKESAVQGLLDTCDVLVDGPFVLPQRSLELDFRGSANQRLVDLKESGKQGQAVLWQRVRW
jgi:anaerobic ribonucleoside-triphosphate reductase activating protein